MENQKTARKENSITTIAEALGVSTATVSRVLNNKPNVKPETREKILSFANELKIQLRPGPNAELRLLGIVNDFDHYPIAEYYVAALIDRLSVAIIRNGYYPVLIPSAVVDREIRWPDQSGIFRQVSGIVWNMPIFTERYERFVKQRNLHCIVLNNLAQNTEAHFIECDNITSVRQAVEYLYAMGHRKIGFVGGALFIRNIRDRYSTYLQCMSDMGLEINRDWIIDDIQVINADGAREGIIRLLGRKSLPTAIICANDPIAIATYAVFKERGIRIPDDVSLISFDNDPESEYLSPPLTTFRQPFTELADNAIDLVMKLIDGEKAETASVHAYEKTVINMQLIIRQSVKDCTKHDSV